MKPINKFHNLCNMVIRYRLRLSFTFALQFEGRNPVFTSLQASRTLVMDCFMFNLTVEDCF